MEKSQSESRVKTPILEKELFGYQIVISEATLKKVEIYFQQLMLNEKKPGERFNKVFKDFQIEKHSEFTINALSIDEFLQCIIRTKELENTDIRGDGTDWNKEELS